MASTKFIKGIGDEELIARVWDIVKGGADEFVEGQVTRGEGDTGHPYNVYLTYTTRLDGEEEDSTLTDTYDVDDYDIEPFDWGGGDAITRIRLLWRKDMFDRFGEDYANRYLFGMLEEALEANRNGNWLIED